MKAKIEIIVLFFFVLSGCRKEPTINQAKPTNQTSKETLTLSDAKKYIDFIRLDSNKALDTLLIDWGISINERTETGNIFRIKLSGQPTYQNYKQGYRELVILRNRKNYQIEAKILEVIPDAIYLQKNRKTDSKTFTGRVFEYNLNYSFLGGRIYSEGKPVGEIKQLSDRERLEQANHQLMDLNPITRIQGKVMKFRLIEACTWLQDSYVDANGDLTIHSQRICTSTYFDDGGGGGGIYDGVGGGGENPVGSEGGADDNSTGSGGSSNSVPTPSNLPGETSTPVNPKEMTECFSEISNPNAAYIVRVYVIEPQPGTSFNVGTNSFGHVAISLSKTDGNRTITQTIGFYPTGTGLDKLDSKSQILNNGDIKYDIGATYYVSGDSFQRVINYVNYPPKNYHFTDFNCSAFVYAAGLAGGISIPNPTTQIGLGGPGGISYAKTPAGMASALREQKAKNPNLDINEAGGRAPGSNGPCNIK